MSTSENNQINDPAFPYAKKRITFCSSFEEMENHQLAYCASLSPSELLQNHKVLSMAAYGLQTDFDAGATERKIKFGKKA